MLKKNLATWAVASLFTLASVPSMAATVTYNLVRTSTLTNVDDTEGRWQFSGGKVYIGNFEVGHFISKKRVSFGVPSSVNKAAVETTIIWNWGDHNFTLQGTHYFGDGQQVGGVSATSPGFSAFKDATYGGTHQQITVTY